MKFEGFSPGVWRQQYQYKSFSPVLVNQPWLWEDPRINTLLEQATRALGELNAFSLIVPDEVRVKNVLALARAGYTKNILLSHDSISCWQGRPLPFANRHEDVLAMLPDWRPTTILRKIVPQLREGGLDQADIDMLLVENPRRFFTGA